MWSCMRFLVMYHVASVTMDHTINETIFGTDSLYIDRGNLIYLLGRGTQLT